MVQHLTMKMSFRSKTGLISRKACRGLPSPAKKIHVKIDLFDAFFFSFLFVRGVRERLDWARTGLVPVRQSESDSKIG